LGITVGTVPGTVREAVRMETYGGTLTVVSGVTSAAVCAGIGKEICGGIHRSILGQTCGAILDETATMVPEEIRRRTVGGISVGTWTATQKGIRW
jgi:hypothetical protein